MYLGVFYLYCALYLTNVYWKSNFHHQVEAQWCDSFAINLNVKTTHDSSKLPNCLSCFVNISVFWTKFTKKRSLMILLWNVNNISNQSIKYSVSPVNLIPTIFYHWTRCTIIEAMCIEIWIKHLHTLKSMQILDQCTLQGESFSSSKDSNSFVVASM